MYLNQVFREEFSQYVAYSGHSFITSSKKNEGEVAGNTIFSNFDDRCSLFLGKAIFCYSCGRPHVRLVNLFLSVICKDFLHRFAF